MDRIERITLCRKWAGYTKGPEQRYWLAELRIAQGRWS